MWDTLGYLRISDEEIRRLLSRTYCERHRCYTQRMLYSYWSLSSREIWSTIIFSSNMKEEWKWFSLKAAQRTLENPRVLTFGGEPSTQKRKRNTEEGENGKKSDRLNIVKVHHVYENMIRISLYPTDIN